MIDFKPGLKLPAVVDFRSIPLRSILNLKMLPDLPDTYDIDEVLAVQDDRVFENDKYGNCVKAAIAHATMRHEKYEQGVVIPIADAEVSAEYFRESGGEDSGLYLTYAMKDWRNHGMTFGGKKYDIYAFADIAPRDHMQVKYATFLLRGIIFGMQIFQADLDQFNNHEPWHLTGQNGSFRGGHGVYACAYKDSAEPAVHFTSDPTKIYWLCSSVNGVWCMTWGRKQFMTWDFWDARVNQAYAVVDNVNKWMADTSPVDVDKLNAYLSEITGATPEEDDKLCPVSRIVGNILKELVV